MIKIETQHRNMELRAAGLNFQVIEVHMGFANGHQGYQLRKLESRFLHRREGDDVHIHGILFADQVQQGDLQFMQIKIIKIDLRSQGRVPCFCQGKPAITHSYFVYMEP